MKKRLQKGMPKWLSVLLGISLLVVCILTACESAMNTFQPQTIKTLVGLEKEAVLEKLDLKESDLQTVDNSPNLTIDNSIRYADSDFDIYFYFSTYEYIQTESLLAVQYRLNFEGEDKIERAVDAMELIVNELIQDFGSIWYNINGGQSFTKESNPIEYLQDGRALTEVWGISEEEPIWLFTRIFCPEDVCIILITIQYNFELGVPDAEKYQVVEGEATTPKQDNFTDLILGQANNSEK